MVHIRKSIRWELWYGTLAELEGEQLILLPLIYFLIFSLSHPASNILLNLSPVLLKFKRQNIWHGDPKEVSRQFLCLKCLLLGSPIGSSLIPAAQLAPAGSLPANKARVVSADDQRPIHDCTCFLFFSFWILKVQWQEFSCSLLPCSQYVVWKTGYSTCIVWMDK